MIKPIPPPQWQTSEARQWVAQHLSLPYHDGMQDWPWEVATPKDLDAYFQLYACATAAPRVVLMEMLLQAASDQPTLFELVTTWHKIQVLLEQQADLHASTVRYWCTWQYNEQEVQEYGFPITPYLREWWRANYPLPMVSS